jgi:hypothetical protein
LKNGNHIRIRKKLAPFANAGVQKLKKSEHKITLLYSG